VWIQAPDGKPQAVQVLLGISDGQSTEIVRGELQEGQEIITGLAGAPTPGSRPGAQPGGSPRLRL
jgi:HlyD family secretion protein